MIIPLLVFAQISGVQLTSDVTPRTVYVGQQVTYDGALRVTDYAAKAFREEPDYTPPDVRGTTSYDIPFDPGTIQSSTINGLTFQRYIYKRAFFPIAAGIYTVPPATLIVVMGDLHDPYIHKQDTLHSPAVTFTVLPLPVEGRPPEFTGAVGKFAITAQVNTKVVNAGESFVLTVVVQGEGNLELLPRPVVAIPWATIVKGPEQAKWDSAGTVVRGTKMFQWTVTPKDSATGVIPAIRYGYFDPATKRYATASAEPISLAVGTVTGTTSSSASDDSAAAHDPGAATSPFPFLLRAIRAHLFVVIGAGVAVLALIAFALTRHRPSDDEDAS